MSSVGFDPLVSERFLEYIGPENNSRFHFGNARERRAQARVTVAYSGNKRLNMLGLILLVFLVLMLLGALPTWPHSRTWGYYPSSGIGLLTVIVIVILLVH